MDVQEREKFYDEKIAPELLRLGSLCGDNGLSFVAGVEWDPGEVGRTTRLMKDAGEVMRHANQTLQGNFGVGMVALTVTTPKEAR
jgi:hypothetical protein